MASSAVTSPPGRVTLRDPVLLLPLVVACGLGIGALGVRAHVSGARIAVDLALAWSSVSVALVVLERPRWRPAAWLLAGAALALLGSDLEWAASRSLATVGVALQGLWAAILIQLVLTFPEGRRPSAAARAAILGAYAVTFGGQLVGLVVASGGRDVLAVTTHPAVAHAVDRAQAIAAAVLAVVVVVLVVHHGRSLRGPTRRTQGPLHVAACGTGLVAAVWLGWVLVTGERAPSLETFTRAIGLTVPLSIAAGIAWSRLRRPQASELVVELRREAATTMRERLSRALSDPTLDVAYRLADDLYVDAAGRRFELPGGDDRALTTVTLGGEEIAVLVHDPALLDDPALVESVQATAALVLENERLAAEVRSQLAEVQRSRGRIVAAADAERRRIERNLHDGAQQRLVTLSVALALEASHADAAAALILARAQDEVEGAIEELRELARGIHPTLLRHEGLPAAVEALARRAPMSVTVTAAVADRLPEAVELAAYFVVSESLTNVVKHASATHVTVELTREANRFVVAVRDDGVGGARITPESGLAGLRDRLEALDATLSIDSATEGGTTVRASFRCES